MGIINVNGKTISINDNSSIEINNNGIFINGKEASSFDDFQNQKNIIININGDIQNLSCGDCTVHGNVHTLKCSSAKVEGDILGNISAANIITKGNICGATRNYPKW